MSIGLGIVGLGPAGTAMLGAAFGHDQVSVVAIADTDLEWLGPAAGPPRRYGSLQRLLEDDQVEAVHIATPTQVHFDHVLQALRAGRHVIVEKPVTATAADAEELMTRAAEFGRVVIVGHSEAFEPYVQAVSRAVAAGAVGTPTTVLAEKFTDWMRRPRLPAEWDGASGGGLIRRQGVHQVDVLRTITGADFTVREATAPGAPVPGPGGTIPGSPGPVRQGTDPGARHAGRDRRQLTAGRRDHRGRHPGRGPDGVRRGQARRPR